MPHRLIVRLHDIRPVVALMAALSALSFTLLGTSAAVAGEADVVDLAISNLGDGSFQIDASVRHDDTGWEHYANRWDVLAPDGTELGSRELLHPHVDEQPFTRSLTLAIPADVTTVTVRAADLVHGLGGEEMTIDVPH